MWTRLGFQNPLLYIKTLLNYLNLLFFHCSYHRAIVTFLQWQQEFNYFFSPTQSKRKWHVITKQRELQYDCNSPQRCDPWMSVWEHPTTGWIIQWAAFFIWHERRTRVWVTEVNECRKNKSRRSNAIRENRWVSGGVAGWGSGSFAVPCLPPSLFGWKLPRNPAAPLRGEGWLTHADT